MCACSTVPAPAGRHRDLSMTASSALTAGRAAALMLALCLTSCDQSQQDSYELTPPPVPSYTTHEFAGLVLGKDRKTVRRLLGPPSNIISRPYDDVETWYYWTDKVRVENAEAGIVIPGGVGVNFANSSGVVRDVIL